MDTIVSKCLSSNPFKRGMIECGVLIASGICGLWFSWYKLSVFPFTNILGAALIIFAFLFHWRAEKDHKQAHEKTDRIEAIVTTGVYSKIRHPLYLSLILLNLGIGLAFGDAVTFCLSVLTIFHWMATSRKEEQLLQLKFREAYTEYKNAVPWKLIPGIY